VSAQKPVHKNFHLNLAPNQLLAKTHVRFPHARCYHKAGLKPMTKQNRDRQGAAQNSRTHGFCSKDHLVANEDQQEFESMELQLVLDIGPKGQLEQILFDELLIASWQLRRIARMETELSSGHASYTALLDDESLQKKLDRLGRHHTRFERTFHRSLKELKALQTNRALKEDAPEENRERPDLATAAKPVTKISKRTQPASEPAPEEPVSPEECAELESLFAQMDARFAPPIKITDEAA
jgi:hypothetical protein